MEAVVLDLFGTLVAAPTPDERAEAASRLARVIGCEPAAVERYLVDSWRLRHDGTLPTVADLAAHLVRAVGGRDRVVALVAGELSRLGQARLVPDASVHQTLEFLSAAGLRVGVLSDASAEIAAVWHSGQLAELVDTAVFSCTAGHLKPDQRLYGTISRELAVPAQRTLYLGDGGGNELNGALAFGMQAVAVRRRGCSDSLTFGDRPWSGAVMDSVEDLPTYLAELS